MRENIKIVVEGIKKLRENIKIVKEGKRGLTILIDFFQIAVYLTLCFKRYLVSDFITSNY